MNETRAILEAYARAVRAQVPIALATVVRVEGSAYRRPGARLLMTEDGRMTGSLSGGCLERDVLEHARVVMSTREPLVIRYDTGADADLVWGLGLGCEGVVQVLLEPLDPETMPGHLKLLAEGITRQTSSVIATVFGVQEATPGAMRTEETGVKPGSRLLLDSKGRLLIEFKHEALARAMEQEARAALRANASSVSVYELAAGAVEVFIEVVEPPTPLVVFGANADAVPVLEFAQKLGWQVTVVDTQARPASRDRFASADAVLLCRPEQVADCVPLTPRTLTLVMTHNYLHDLALFQTLLSSPVRYIGMLGPKHRTERIIAAAAVKGMAMGHLERQRLYSPVGLDLGAETPAEVALSIIAEIKATLAARGGGCLRDRHAPIHDATRTGTLPVSPQPTLTMPRVPAEGE